MTERTGDGDPRARLIAAFAAIYVIWGSTYLAIKFAIETIPPFLMAATRFLVAGALLYGWMRFRGTPKPPRETWGPAAIVGALLLLFGNGTVVWAEQRVPSGLAALIVSVVPLWMVLIDWLRPGGMRPRGMVIAGVLLGLAGVIVLIGPGDLAGGNGVDPLGAAALTLGSLCWAAGSIYAMHAKLPERAGLATAMEMLAGGALLALTGLAFGEAGRLDVGAITPRSALSLLYLIIFGSLIAFSAYVWLLTKSTPARVATHSYVNPVVAVILGWALASEPLSLRTLIAAAVIVGSVALITTARSERGSAHRGIPDRAEAARPPEIRVVRRRFRRVS